MAETGGLENHCAGNRTGGSNPSPSATQSAMQRKLAKFPGQSGGMAAISRISFQNRTGENVPLIPRGERYPAFFSAGPTRSPVSTRVLGECNAIRNRWYSESDLTYLTSLDLIGARGKRKTRPPRTPESLTSARRSLLYREGHVRGVRNVSARGGHLHNI